VSNNDRYSQKQAPHPSYQFMITNASATSALPLHWLLMIVEAGYQLLTSVA